MATATMTSKGQITIPQEVRRKLGLDSGDRVELIEQEDGSFLLRPALEDVRSLKGVLRKPQKPVSIEDMAAAIRRRAAGR